ncbi:IS66-like element accessory protein TnpA [Hydrogenophaga atypica]|uniref:Transposase n=1 Tax=Hydrogenophaga atypica TaxID=249409 RepID=A0ABW2QTY9_9BURK
MRNGKRIYVSAFKAWLVEQALRPEASVAGLALRHGVNANQLRSWMKLEHWQSTPHTLLPVTVVADARSAEVVATTNARQPKAVMEIEVCGTVIRLRGPVDPEQLKTVLAVLRA